MAYIVFFELEPWEQHYVTTKLQGHKLVFFNKEITRKSIEKVKDADALALFVHSKVDAKIINRMKKLKLIIAMSTGYDHIDLKTCKSKGIVVCNVPYYGENTVAEYTFALLLSLSRKIHETYVKTKAGDFSIKGLRGFDLKGKTLGVIGVGHIGQHVAAMAKGFEMNVIGYNREHDAKLAKKRGFTYVSMPTLLKKADIITLHVPYTKETHHLIDKEKVTMMKKGVVLLNTCRGPVVDTDALVYGLKKKIISGAGLDVLEAETFIHDEKNLLKNREIESSQLRTMLENHMLLEEHKSLLHHIMHLTPPKQ